MGIRVKPKISTDLLFEDIVVNKNNAPRYILDGSEVDIWDEPYIYFHSRSPVDYIRDKILEYDKKGEDPFPDVIGKKREKELIKNALLSGSSILFKGKKGYGKTTFSKSIAKLLPAKILAIKDCKIHDDPTHPSCFSCKEKIVEHNTVEITWVPRIWVRIPGDPMLTTRQLIGGISIQKIRDGYDLDHPEVFIPGRALKAHRGVGYYDELGAIPSSLQTLLHELFEEKQVTTTEGDVVPFKLDAVILAATNPANYRGTNPIKEPLLDRMEEIEIGPPETLEEEIEIGKRNMYLVKIKGLEPEIPDWHLKTLAKIVRYARDKERRDIASKIDTEPSCRATIKLFDHIKSVAIRNGRQIPLLSDYGDSYDTVKLALTGRIELVYGVRETKEEVIKRLVEMALNDICKDIYQKIPEDRFEEFYEGLRKIGEPLNGQSYIKIDLKIVQKLRKDKEISYVIERFLENEKYNDELYLSAFEIILESMARCMNTPERKYVERKNKGYIISDLE
ncbi:MAG: AAA family ATPase [Nitrososphaerales archaeon]